MWCYRGEPLAERARLCQSHDLRWYRKRSTAPRWGPGSLWQNPHPVGKRCLRAIATRCECSASLKLTVIVAPPDAAKAEFTEESTWVDLFEEAGTQGVGDLKDSPQHALC